MNLETVTFIYNYKCYKMSCRGKSIEPEITKKKLEKLSVQTCAKPENI